MLHSFLKHIFGNNLVLRLFSEDMKERKSLERGHESQGRVQILKPGS